MPCANTRTTTSSGMPHIRPRPATASSRKRRCGWSRPRQARRPMTMRTSAGSDAAPKDSTWRPNMTSMGAVVVAVVLLAMLAAGCVWSVPQPTLIREPRPDAVPLRIGVYYPSELRGFTYRHHLTDTTWVLGTPSMQLLTDAFRLLFVDVVEVSRRPSNAVAAPDVVAVIEPRIVSAGFRYP